MADPIYIRDVPLDIPFSYAGTGIQTILLRPHT